MIDVTIEKQDKNKVKDGVWVKVCKYDGIWYHWEEETAIASLVPEEETGEIRIRPATCREYRNAIGISQLMLSNQLSSPSEKAIEASTSSTLNAINDTLILEWRGWKTKSKNNGSLEEFSYSKKNCKYLLENDPSFIVMIREICAKTKLFGIDIEEVKKI